MISSHRSPSIYSRTSSLTASSNFQLVLLEKVSMKVDFKKYGEVVSLSDFVIVVRTHTRVPYLFSKWMVVHFESV